MTRLSIRRANLPSLRQATTVLLIGLSMVWAIWATKTLVELRERHIVTVHLAAMMEEFVASEARAQHSPAEAQTRITSYLQGVQSVIDSLSKDGTTVLVAEAVISGSVPDYSARVKDRVDQWMKNHDPR